MLRPDEAGTLVSTQMEDRPMQLIHEIIARTSGKSVSLDDRYEQRFETLARSAQGPVRQPTFFKVVRMQAELQAA